MSVILYRKTVAGRRAWPWTHHYRFAEPAFRSPAPHWLAKSSPNQLRRCRCRYGNGETRVTVTWLVSVSWQRAAEWSGYCASSGRFFSLTLFSLLLAAGRCHYTRHLKKSAEGAQHVRDEFCSTVGTLFNDVLTKSATLWCSWPTTSWQMWRSSVTALISSL